MDILTATSDFEHWLSPQVPIVRGDLRQKHTAMGHDVFSFLRATYYRWAQQFLELDPLVSRAAKVLAVGDLHLENFGTWRDSLGRMAWGVNDFDEAFGLPYTNDLVRLATSALVAVDADHLRMKGKDACNAIADGYREGIAIGGRPFIIGDDHRWFKPILQSPQRDPGLFWDKLRKLPRDKSPLPKAAKAAIVQVLPDRRIPFKVRHRIAGLGNLGKPRYTAIAHWNGGPLAREVKALTLSAAGWATSDSKGPFYENIISRAIRSADPYLKEHGSWVVRRLSPDCRRLEMASLTRVKDEEWLLNAMGFEIANIHLGTSGALRSIKKHMADSPKNALRKAAIAMHEKIAKDFRHWRRAQ
jgi:hypothetical protein